LRYFLLEDYVERSLGLTVPTRSGVQGPMASNINSLMIHVLVNSRRFPHLLDFPAGNWYRIEFPMAWWDPPVWPLFSRILYFADVSAHWHILPQILPNSSPFVHARRQGSLMVPSFQLADYGHMHLIRARPVYMRIWSGSGDKWKSISTGHLRWN
jgi:hypothetical protein